MKLRGARGFAIAVVLAASGCRQDSGNNVVQAPPSTSPADAGTRPGSGRDAGAPAVDAGPTGSDACTLGATACDGFGSVRQCQTSPSTGYTVWVETPCANGSACLGGQCVSSCNDSCTLGQTRQVDGGTQTCTLISLDGRGPTDAGTGLHDRARGYEAYLQQWSLAAGQIANTDFTDPSLTTVDHYDGVGDSAIWTGTYLAGEALRAKATHDPIALQNVATLVQQIHLMWSVSQSPGWLARFAAPDNAPPIIHSLFDPNDTMWTHFDGQYNGQTYDWIGHISRDQYQGVMLGYALAYEVLQDESLKETIRSDVVTFVQELMKQRTLCPTIDGVICLTPLNVQYVVVTDKEPLDFEIDTSSSGKIASMSGFQEFMPMLIGLYPRPSSAIMLASFFEVALEVTDGVPAYATQRAAILDHFNQNVESWLQVAEGWTFSKNCGNNYYGNNISFEPVYNLARLDQDPTRSNEIRSLLLERVMWTPVSDNKNVWFAYIYAANAPAGSPLEPDAVAMANTQLAQFSPAPRVHVARNNSFPPDPSCPNQALDAIDVQDRTVDDFIWQRGSWTLTDPGNPSQVYPGVDYLAAYWMGRAHGFLTEDAPGTCAVWMP